MRSVIDSDLPPELASGNRIEGIYRISPHRASSEDQDADRDVDRHVTRRQNDFDSEELS